MPINIKDSIESSTIKGSLNGNASTATKATQDSAGQQINKTYIKGLSVSGKTITYTKGDGTTGTITTQDTNTDTNTTYTLSKSGSTITLTGSDGKTTSVSDSNTTYSTGTTSAAGLTKLYTGTGTATDGTMTQAALKTALDGKANSSHGRHIPDACTTITDWNSATTNGWYMGNNATNAPTSGSNVWYFGEVVAHNTNYVIQTVYQFTASTDAKAIPKYIRAKTNGTWGAWTNVTVAKAVPSNAVFTDTNTWRGVQDNLTSTATDQSLSANQGKVLKGLVDGKAASSHTHNYAGSSSAGGNANAAVKLATARTINGTSFDGSANITTANWGTARTLTIGSTGKSVNGSGNVSWSLSEIGALPLTGGTLSGRLTANGKISLPTTGSSWINGATLTNASIAITTQQASGSYHPVLAVKTSGNHVANIGGIGDDFGFYGFKSGRTENGTDWSFKINASNGAIASTGNITAPTFVGSLSGNASTATKLATARTINGTSFNGSGNITTANWGTARTLTIGNTGKSVNGSGNVSWSLSEIGAASTATATTSSNGLMTSSMVSTLNTASSRASDWNTFKASGGAINGDIAIEKHLANLKIGDSFNIKTYDQNTELSSDWNKGIVLRVRSNASDSASYVRLNGVNFAGNGNMSLGEESTPWTDIYLKGVSKSSNGYTKLPNGLMIQWGHLNLGNNLGSGVIRVTASFPIQFPKDILHVYLTPTVNHYYIDDEYSASWERPPVICQIKPSNFEFAFQRLQGHYGAGITWFAIGY